MSGNIKSIVVKLSGSKGKEEFSVEDGMKTLNYKILGDYLVIHTGEFSRHFPSHSIQGFDVVWG